MSLGGGSDDVTGTSPAIRASTSRGARPRSRIAVSHGVVVSRPRRRRSTTARTRPSASPSNRTRRPWSASQGTPSGGVPMATASPRSTPAAWSRSAARAVTRPARPLPGQTGWSSAAPVATTISWRMNVEHPGRRPRDDRRAGIDRDDLVAIRCVEDQATLRPHSPRRPPAAARPLAPPPMTATSISIRRTSISRPAGVRARSESAATRERRQAADGMAHDRQARAAAPTWQVRT